MLLQRRSSWKHCRCNKRRMDIQSVFDLISLLRKIKTEKDTVDVYCTVKKYLILEVKSIDLLLF